MGNGLWNKHHVTTVNSWTFGNRDQTVVHWIVFMEITLLRSNLSRSSTQSDECNSAMMREGGKQELRQFQRESPWGSPRPLFTKIRKLLCHKQCRRFCYSLELYYLNMIRYGLFLPKNAKVILCSVTMCSYSIFNRVNPSRNTMWASRHLGTQSRHANHYSFCLIITHFSPWNQHFCLI